MNDGHNALCDKSHAGGEIKDFALNTACPATSLRRLLLAGS